MNSEPSSNPPGSTPVIKVIGVGDAGAKIVTALGGAERLHCVAFNTDAANGAPERGVDFITFGRKTTRGMSAGGEADRGRAAAEEDEAKFVGACAGAAMVFIVAGMGGGTGTGAAPVIARAAKRAGALVLAFVASPFEFEGPRRFRNAQAGVEALKHEADAVVVVPNERIAHIVGEPASLYESFHAANKLIANGIRAVARLLTTRGLIHLDFPSLAGAIRGRHTESSLAIAEATGADRAKEIVRQLAGSPMLAGGEALKAADSVLVSIVGGADLALAEVKALMKDLNARCAKGNVTLGAVNDPAFTGRMAVAVIATTRAEPTAEMTARISSSATKSPARARDTSIETEFVKKPESAMRPRRAIRPELPPEAQEEILSQHRQTAPRGRRRRSDLQQQLPLEIVSKGRFEKSEPTIHHGEDLDVPTFIRRGIVLN